MQVGFGRSGVERMTADSSTPIDFSSGLAIPDPYLSANIQFARLGHSDFDGRRKRKSTVFEDDSDSEDDAKSTRTDGDSKSNGSRPSNHSEIEKRRRDKMNLYIGEISALVPMCAAMSRKLDKLTVLKLAAQHIKTLRGCVQSCGEGVYKPSCIQEDELKELFDASAEGFLIVISCDRGRILHISTSIEQVLGWTVEELAGKSCFDIVHKEDAGKLKDQMSNAPLTDGSEGYEQHSAESVTSSTGSFSGGLSCFSSGAKRFFHCRMKRKAEVRDHGKNAGHRLHPDSKKLVTMRCSGYLKTWPPALSLSQQETPTTSDADALPNFTCLVLGMAPGHVTDISTHSKFSCRLGLDGRFLFVEQSVCSVLGYLSQELIGRSYYDYIHEDDLLKVVELHKNVDGEGHEDSYSVKTKGDQFLKLVGHWRSFRSPWTKELEFLTVQHSPTPSQQQTANSAAGTDMVSRKSSTLAELLTKLPPNCSPSGKPLHTKAGAGKIGEIIAEQCLETKTSSTSESSAKSPKDAELDGKSEEEREKQGIASRQLERNQCGRKKSQDEATMSVLMSVLDADGGLGGPVDYGTLPWPL